MTRARIAALILSGTLASIAGAQQPAQKPFSAGDVLLLSNSSDVSSAAESLRSALLAPEPSVRMAAARVIAVVPHGTLRGALIGAVAREQNPAAAAEMVHDLLLLSGAADLPLIETQVRRFGGVVALSLAEWLARERPREFAQRLAELTTQAGASAKDLDSAVVVAAVQHPSDASAVYRAWMAVAPAGGWDAALRRGFALDDVAAAAEPAVADALDSTVKGISEDTVWFVLGRIIDKSTLSAALVAKASTPREGVTPWEAFGRELLARGSNSKSATDRREVIEREGPSHRSDLRHLQEAPQLTAQERDAVLAIMPMVKVPTFDFDRVGDAGATIASPASGAVGSTLAAAGCSVGHGDRIGVVTIQYGSDGRPLHITVDPTGLNQPCLSALSALARTAVLDRRKPATQDTQKLILPLNPVFLRCVDEEPSTTTPVRVSGAGRVEPPRKTKDVRPVYPDAAQRARIQGLVIIDAMISTTGCVSHARVLRSMPYLDIPAVQAVSQWVFQPARVNDEPLPVFMTVTVNFALQ